VACGFQNRSRFIFSSVEVATIVKAILKELNCAAEFFGICIYVIFRASAVHPATIKSTIKVSCKVAAQTIKLADCVAQIAAIVSAIAAIIVSIVVGITIVWVTIITRASPLGGGHSRQAQR
jgi:hypothetical protein